MAKLNLVKRNKALLTSNISTRSKATFYPAIGAALFKSLLLPRAKRKMHYFGHDFAYDNLATPLSLMYYPKTASNVLSNMHVQPKNILDIGGNIGQFSVTMSAMLKNSPKIDVFEPNFAIADMLSSNIRYYKNIRYFNYAIADGSQIELFYTPSKSSTGSLYKLNAKHHNLPIKRLKVPAVRNISSVTGQHSYDLIKIDVEGYEHDLVKVITGQLRTKYMYIEISNKARQRNYSHSKILALVAKKFGPFDLVYADLSDSKVNSFNALLKFTGDA